MEKNQFNTINKKLDVLIGLFTMNITKGKTLQDQAELLKSLGLTQSEIASSLGKTTNNIKQALHRSRVMKKPRKKNLKKSGK